MPAANEMTMGPDTAWGVRGSCIEVFPGSRKRNNRAKYRTGPQPHKIPFLL